MTKHKPFSKTEMKILIFNKMKSGLSYDQAYKELSGEINQCIENSKETKKDAPDFKKEFHKLTHEKK